MGQMTDDLNLAFRRRPPSLIIICVGIGIGMGISILIIFMSIIMTIAGADGG